MTGPIETLAKAIGGAASLLVGVCLALAGIAQTVGAGYSLLNGTVPLHIGPPPGEGAITILLIYGVNAIVIVVGVGFIFAGFTLCRAAIRMWNRIDAR